MGWANACNRICKMLKHREIKAVIFDFDGVIIDSLPRAFEVWEFAFKKFKKKDVKLDRDFFEVNYRDLAKKINILIEAGILKTG